MGKLDLLKALYGEVLVPEAVWRELMRPVAEAWEELPRYVTPLLKARAEGWLRVEAVRSPKALELLNGLKHLDLGEREAIALAIERGIQVVLTNDKVAHDEALTRGLKPRWFTQILLEALEKGLLDADEYVQTLVRAVRPGLWVSKEVLKRAVELARRAQAR